jgi:hypothetical protein
MANPIIYQDFTLDFNIHPIRKDLVLKNNEDVVIESIKNLLRLNHYESPFHPEIGCNIRKLLFENVSEFTARDLSRFIQETIENFEPRCTIQSLVVSPNEDLNAYNIKLRVFVNTFPNALSVDFILERVR